MYLILKKIRQTSQYKLEEVIDWAACPKYLQFILKEFNLPVVLNKKTFIEYF